MCHVQELLGTCASISSKNAGCHADRLLLFSLSFEPANTLGLGKNHTSNMLVSQYKPLPSSNIDTLFTGYGCAHLPSTQSRQFYTYNLCDVLPHIPLRFMTRIGQRALTAQSCCSSCSYFAMQGRAGFEKPRRQLWGNRCGVTSSPHFSQLRAP